MTAMTSEIWETREEIGARLIRNIREYGTLDGEEEILERPYNDRSAIKYPFTGANYLRVLASGEQDPRWYRLADLRKSGLEATPDAETITLEHWTNLERGINNATARLEPYINARYISNLPPRDRVCLNRGENMDRATRLLQCAEHLAGNREFSYPAGREDMFYRFTVASRKLLAKEIGEPEARESLAPQLASYLAFKTAGLSMDYRKNELFLEKQMEKLDGKQGPKQLFQGMGKASHLLGRIQTAELTLFDDFSHDGKGEFFKDLRVTLHYSEAGDLTGGVHNEHPFRPGVYKHEAAYELLAAMLRVDKERWERSLGKKNSFGRTKISLEYGDFMLKEAVIDLGRLELGNKPTVSQALECRMPREAKKELGNEKDLRFRLFRYDRTLEENREAVQQRKKELEAFIQECHRTSSDIHESEEKYLCVNEEQREEIQKRAPAYLYYFRHSYEVFLSDTNHDFYEVFSAQDTFLNAVVGSPKGNETVADQLYDDGVIVETSHPICDENARPVFLPEEVEDFRNLERLSIAYREEGKPFTKEMPIVRGEKAMEFFISHKLEDGAMAMLSNHPKEYEMGVKMEFRYDDKPFYSIRYTEGSGDLNRKLPVGMPHLEDERDDRIFQQAVHTWAKFNN